MCDGDRCSSCAALEAENAALRVEIQQLRRKLEAIRRFCVLVLNKTQLILSQPKGIKFSKWKFSQGADAVADTVEKMAQ